MLMLNKIHVTNFKKFKDFSLKLEATNILVGPNNCGKSSILDTLRILRACLRHPRTKSPANLEIPGEGVFRGFEVPGSVLPVALANIAHDYSDGDAFLTERF